MTEPFESNPFASLTPADAAALDSLVESGFDPSLAASEPRTARAYALMAGLDSPVADGAPELIADSVIDRNRARLLMDVTMARVLRSRDGTLAGRIAPEGHEGDGLSPTDAAALEAMVSSGWKSQDKNTGVGGLLALLDAQQAPTAHDRSVLIDATLARVQQPIDTQRGRLRLSAEPATETGRSRIRLADFGAIAAIILVGFSVLSPLVTASRESAREQICSANLARAGMGFSLFGASNDNRLPQAERATDTSAAMPWWNVGQKPSHSANLYVLIRDGYVLISDLACPGNQSAPVNLTDPNATDWKSPSEVSYSYQLFGRTPPRLTSDTRMVLLTDKSPVVDRARRGESFNPMAPSHNHSSRGQNVLFSDSSVQFLGTPVLDTGDNIWIPRSADGRDRSTLTGREAPFSRDDAFVGP